MPRRVTDKMQVEYVTRAKLRPAAYNPRKMTPKERASLTESLKRFGFAEPIVVNRRKGRENVVVGGHQRLEIAKALQIESVPCVFVDLDEKRERELNLRLNKNLGAWDWEVLKTFEASDLLEVGFEPMELRFNHGSQSDDVDEDDGPTDRPAARVRVGQTWSLGRHVLVCGDSRSSSCYAGFSGMTVHAIVTDPPYGVSFGKSKGPTHKHRTIANDELTGSEYSAFSAAWIANALATLRAGDVYVFGASSPEGWRMFTALNDAGARWSAILIWKKQQLVIGPANYQRIYEPIYYGCLGKSSWHGGRSQVEVIEFDRPRSSPDHPTMKPVGLLSRLIQNSTPGDGAVLDPFLGSGSTLIACEKTGRSCVGLELEPHYCDVIIARWEALTGSKAVPLAESESHEKDR